MKQFRLLFLLLLMGMSCSEAANPLGVPSPLPTPLPATQVIESKINLERLPQGGDFRTQTTFLGDPKTGFVWEVGPDGNVYSFMRLKPWITSKNNKLKVERRPLTIWLNEIVKSPKDKSR